MLHSFCNNILLLITSFLTHSISQYTRHRHKMKEIFLTLPSSLPVVSIFLSFPFTFSKSGTFSPFLSLSHPAHYHFRRLSSFFSSPPLSLFLVICIFFVFLLSLSALLYLCLLSLSPHIALSLSHPLTHSLTLDRATRNYHWHAISPETFSFSNTLSLFL